MELWEEQDVMFVETPVVEDILQILESEHSVFVVGEPGIGKSMLMHHIALKLHSQMNYNIIPCSAIKDIKHHYKEGIKQMFVLDDIFGQFTASIDEIEYLKKNGDIFKRMLEKGKTKIAATCRLDIYLDENVHASGTVFISNVSNLYEKYSPENKFTICAKYLTEANIKLLKEKDAKFTPLMCYLYSKNEKFNLTDFLHCPYATYQKEWDKLKSIDPYKYCALFLCVLHNGIIKKSLFDSENIDSKTFDNIFKICGVCDGTLCKMGAVFDSIIGTYVRKISNEYRVIHDQMFDFMCGYFGNKDTMVRCIVRDACIQILNERTHLESRDEQRREYTILIPHMYEQEFFGRILNEWQLGNVTECSLNRLMNHEQFRASFIEELKSINDKFIFVEEKPGTFSKKYKQSYLNFLITSCIQGYYDIVQFFISNDADLIIANDADLKNSVTLLPAACEGGSEIIVQLLIDKGCNINQADGMGETGLTAACKGGHKKIVQLLIDKGCNINQFEGCGQTPLTAACRTGNEEIVKLLIDKGCNINQADGMGETALTAACKGGHKKIVQLLIDKGCNINQFEGWGQTPLTAACRTGNEEIVKLLIDKGCNIKQADGCKQTPLEAACKGGHTKIELLLKNKKCNIKQPVDMGCCAS